MTNLKCTWLCGFETGSVLEGTTINHSGGMPTAVYSVVAVPSPPANIAMGSYCLKFDSTLGAADNLIKILNNSSAGQGGGLSVMWQPLTNPAAKSDIIGWRDSQGIQGYMITWDGADKKLKVIDNADSDGGGLGSVIGSGSLTYDAASPAWYCIATRWEQAIAGGAGTIYVGVFNTDRQLLEEFVIKGTRATPDYSVAQGVQIGLLYNSGGAWYMDNIYAVMGSGYYPPICASFASGVPTSVSTNHTSWLRGDTGVDDAVNEWPMIDEIPPDDTDFIKTTVTGAATQYQGHAAGLVPTGQNPLAVGVVGRYLASPGGGGTNSSRFGVVLKLSTALIASDGKHINDTLAPSSSVDNVWGHHPLLASSTKPGGGAWAIADVDNVEIGANKTLSAAITNECSQLLMYAVYGPDWPIAGPVQHGAEVI